MMTRGTTRTVWLVGKYAVKVPRASTSYPGHGLKMFLRGWLANIDEVFWWKHSHKRSKMCPVRRSFLFGFVLVMDRASPLTWDEYDSIDLEEFKDLPMDSKMQNFGKLGDGSVVLVDYADSRYMCSDCSQCFKNR